jgi:hypothetical protein
MTFPTGGGAGSRNLAQLAVGFPLAGGRKSSSRRGLVSEAPAGP